MARLDQREDAEQRRRAREEEQRLRRRPAGVGSFDDGVDEQDEGAGDGQRPGGVVAPPRRGRATLGEQNRAERDREEADRDVDEEDPLPAEAVDEGTADQPGRRRPEAAERSPDSERLVALGSLREQGRDDRERSRGHDRGPDPLEGAGADQRLVRPGEPAEKRSEREESEADHEHPPPPEQVRGSPSEQEQAGEGEGIGAHHPLQPLRREGEILLDRGESDGHDRGVENDHEEGAAEEGERPPAAGIEERARGARPARTVPSSTSEVVFSSRRTIRGRAETHRSPAATLARRRRGRVGRGRRCAGELSGAVRSGSSSRARSAGASPTGTRARPLPPRRPRSRRARRLASRSSSSPGATRRTRLEKPAGSGSRKSASPALSSAVIGACRGARRPGRARGT